MVVVPCKISASADFGAYGKEKEIAVVPCRISAVADNLVKLEISNN